ncbi:MAG: ABC transporter permease [Anaerolineae bacterium]|nr:ABC transporter permease [Anaerolineae bacterium]
MTQRLPKRETILFPPAQPPAAPPARRFFKTMSGAIVILLALLTVLVILAIVLLTLGKDPAAALTRFITGALGTENARADVVMAALPLLLCASGLLVTFTAGLWNIGIEGQIIMGSIFCTSLARVVPADANPLLVIPAELALAMLGGALWAGVSALLKIYGNVNEIFGGVALNFIASNIALFLLNGSWKGSTYPQTAPFEAAAMLPRAGTLRLSILAIVVAVTAFVIVFALLRGTRWGLQLKAMGKSEKSAFLLGVRTRRNLIQAMLLCGALAGLAGSIQILFSYGLLKPGTSGGTGFTAVLLVLLTNVQPSLVPLVTAFFALVPVGNLKLASDLNEAVRVDTSLGSTFQSALVLAVLLFSGARTRWQQRKRKA